MTAKLHDITTVAARALSLCEPSSSEIRRLEATANDVMQLVRKETATSNDVVDVVFGGSFAKGTWLHGDADIDLFVKFRPSVDEKKFEQLGTGIGLRALRNHGPELRYSDHPYVEAFVNGVRINVVPCYDVEQGKWQSAADRSPFHTQLIRENFDDLKRSHARLLKRFLKSAGIYGAEIAVGGFSGYVSEVLVHRFGSFEGVLQAAAALKERQVIAVGDVYDADVVKGFHSPLVIIDPVDGRRNLGTAISPENVAKFALAARAFIQKPSLRFFRLQERAAMSGARTLLPTVLIVEITHRKRSPDTVWGQVKRAMNAMAKQLEVEGFAVLRSSCITDEESHASFAFLLESLTLPRFVKRKGPEVFRRKDASSFIAGAKSRPHVTWIDREMRIATLVDRKATDARQFAKSLFRDRIENSGIPRELVADRNKIRIYSGSDRKIAGLAKKVVGEVVITEHFIGG
jgi:tRNA nucleotidyltransferase (CCA-adding enzyme)